MDYENSKRRCKQTFKGILQLTFSIGFLQEVCALDKERLHYRVKWGAGCVEHSQVRPRFDSLVCDVIPTKDKCIKADIDKESVYMLRSTKLYKRTIYIAG